MAPLYRHRHSRHAIWFLKLFIKLLLTVDKLFYDDKLQMQTLREQGFSAKSIVAKRWKLTTVRTCRRIDHGSTVQRQRGIVMDNRLFHKL